MRDLTATHSLHSLTVRLSVVAAVIDFFFQPLFIPLLSFVIYQIVSVVVCVKASSRHSISRTADTFKRRNSRAVICFMYKKKKTQRSQRRDLKLERLCSVSDPGQMKWTWRRFRQSALLSPLSTVRFLERTRKHKASSAIGPNGWPAQLPARRAAPLY